MATDRSLGPPGLGADAQEDGSSDMELVRIGPAGGDHMCLGQHECHTFVQPMCWVCCRAPWREL